MHPLLCTKRIKITLHLFSFLSFFSTFRRRLKSFDDEHSKETCDISTSLIFQAKGCLNHLIPPLITKALLQYNHPTRLGN